MEETIITKQMLDFVERSKEHLNNTNTNALINEKEGYIAFRDGISESNIRLYTINGESVVFQGQLRNQYTKIVDENVYRDLEIANQILTDIKHLVNHYEHYSDGAKISLIKNLLSNSKGE